MVHLQLCKTRRSAVSEHTPPPVITDPELDHVLRVIFKQKPTDPLYQCLQQNFDDLWGLLIIDKADANALTFVPHGETDEVILTSTPRNKFFGNSLNILKQYPSYRQSIGNPLSDWTTITLDDYRDFIGIANAPTTVPHHALQHFLLHHLLPHS